VRRAGSTILQWLSIILVLLTVILTVFQLISYSRIRANLAPGTIIGGVPVGGLDRQTAADRLIKVYNTAIEVRYDNAVIQIKPANLGFELDLEAMLTAADQKRIDQPFWTGFWDFLWNRFPKPDAVPLRAKISEERLRLYLKDEIATRYNKPASEAIPVPGSTQFLSGQSGTELDIERAVILIKDALQSSNARVVNLTYSQVQPPRPNFQNLQILLQQVIDVTNFDGLTEVYLLDLQTRQEINFAYENGQTLQPGVAFTAASTMKIPIMISVMREVNGTLPLEINSQLELMIERSENDPADRLMESVLGGNLGPLQVTGDLQELGFQNTFLAGYFYPGAPLLQRYETPANKRTDINTNPDTYNQTTPVEMGELMDDLFQCATRDGGTLRAVFAEEITQSECQTMINYLTRNRIGVLIQAGLPETTELAHKHGWITEGDGLIHTISDSAIVYTPGGNFILVIYMYHPVQLVFDNANYLMAQLSSAVYNYYNIKTQ
jgi:beta-lactamase class A